jgi:hypothetical protein
MSFMERACRWVASHMAPPRIIFDREGTSPYLSRHYILGKPHMPDGSDPFNEDGSPKVGVVWPEAPLGLYLHRFHRGDDDQELHCHPWRWACSLILSGGYREERRVRGTDRVETRIVRPGSLNFIRSDDFHRVDLLEGEAWSLFLVGPKFTGWGFWNRDTGTFTPWREFIARKRGEI